MFDRQVGHFAGRYSVITWDLPLHGKSKPYRDFSYANAASELNAILEAEGITQVFLVGMSLGGNVCQPFIELFPEKVRAFVALDTTPFGLQYYSRSDLFWLRHSGTMLSWFPEKMLRDTIIKGNALSDEGRLLMERMLSAYSKKEICDLTGMTFRVFVGENHDIELTCPVLIIVGEKDRSGKVLEYSRVWAAKNNYPIEIVADAAHLSHVDNWQEVNRLIERFIDQHR